MMKKEITDKKSIPHNIVITIVGFLFLFALISNGNMVIAIWDNLDSNVVWLKMLKDNNLFWSMEGSVPFLGGIDRNYLYTDLHIYNWLYMIFPTYQAMVLGWLFKLIFSILGINELGKIILKNKYDKNICTICGLLYGLISSFPTSAFAFSTLPILCVIVYKLYKSFNWRYVVLLFIYPLFSDITLFGIFACGYMLILFVIDLFITRKPKYRLLVGLLALSIGYCVCDWRLIEVMFFNSSKSLKSYDSAGEIESSLIEPLKLSISGFIDGIDHANVFHKYVVIPCLIIRYGIVAKKQIAGEKKYIIKKDPIIYILGLIIFNSIIYGLDSYEPAYNFVIKIIPSLKGFSFARTIWFNPLLWIVAFLIVLSEINSIYLKYALCALYFVVVCFGKSPYNNIRNNIKYLYDKYAEKETELTYNEFYSCDLFTKIKKDIGYNNEWSISFGMHPAIAEYNGIHTLDGYLSYYPQEYKEKFRKIIAPELEKDESNRSYYDNWGGRAYIFSDEVSYWEYDENYNVKEANIYINIEEFKKLKGVYIFSRVKISNYKELNMTYINTYCDERSTYNIYLYKVE